MFYVFLLSFRSVLVRSSFISFSDSRDRFFFSSLVNTQLGRYACKKTLIDVDLVTFNGQYFRLHELLFCLQ